MRVYRHTERESERANLEQCQHFPPVYNKLVGRPAPEVKFVQQPVQLSVQALDNEPPVSLPPVSGHYALAQALSSSAHSVILLLLLLNRYYSLY